jgi:hypothetical protein
MWTEKKAKTTMGKCGDHIPCEKEHDSKGREENVSKFASYARLCPD